MKPWASRTQRWRIKFAPNSKLLTTSLNHKRRRLRIWKVGPKDLLKHTCKELKSQLRLMMQLEILDKRVLMSWKKVFSSTQTSYHRWLSLVKLYNDKLNKKASLWSIVTVSEIWIIKMTVGRVGPNLQPFRVLPHTDKCPAHRTLIYQSSCLLQTTQAATLNCRSKQVCNASKDKHSHSCVQN